MIALPETQRCTSEEWDEFRKRVAHGMLFEVIDWIDQGKPTLRPEKKHTSAFRNALMAPNLSMTQVLWERSWQEEDEAISAMGSLALHRTSAEVMRYLLKNGCPADHVSGYDLCLFHDFDLVQLGLDRGVSLLQPSGWASAFIRVGSRPLIRLYLEFKDKIPGLKKDAVMALCECIEESRLRATALLMWAGVDPLGKSPRYSFHDEQDEKDWNGFPALRIGYAEKALEMLKQLKLKPTTEQWFELLDAVAGRSTDIIEAIMTLRKDPVATFRDNPILASKLLSEFLYPLCWSFSTNSLRNERIADFCIRLIDVGVQLAWKDNSDIASFRREIIRSSNTRLIFKVLSRAAESACDESRSQMAELVRTSKIRELVIQKDPMILKNLGIRGPADYMPLPNVSQRRHKSRTVENPANAIQQVSDPEIIPTEKTIEPLRPFPGHLIKHSGGRVLDRNEIYADVWAEAVVHVAKRYGISGSMLARICTHLNVPRPPLGYWARPEEVRATMKHPLPPCLEGHDSTWAINPTNVQAQKRKK